MRRAPRGSLERVKVVTAIAIAVASMIPAATSAATTKHRRLRARLSRSTVEAQSSLDTFALAAAQSGRWPKAVLTAV
jgi:hypothetical protein